jgi:dUTP pyrophosphatase
VVGLANTIGTIDSDYQGELFLKLRNTSNKTVRVKDMERIMQYMIVKVESITFDLVTEWSDVTDRGTGGDGHTGK